MNRLSAKVLKGFLNLFNKAYCFILLTKVKTSSFLFFKAKFLYNLSQFFLALLILNRFLIYLATLDLAWSFFIFWSISFHLLKYLFLISSFLLNKFNNIFFNICSLFSFFFCFEYILQFLIMILTLEFLASLFAFSFQASITFRIILSLKLS